MVLSPELRQAIEASGGQPVWLTDPTTNAQFVVLPADAYECVQRLIDVGNFDPRTAYPIVNAVMHEDDANDPLLDSYQEYSRTT